MARGEPEKGDAGRLTPSQAVALARTIEPQLRAEGKRRMIAGARRKAKADSRHDTRLAIAARCGFSWPTLKKAARVVDGAAREPQKFAHVVREMDESGNVEAAYWKVLNPQTDRLMTQDPIFAATIIGGVPLGDFTAPEIKWLIGFFAELSKRVGERAEGYAGDMFNAAQVRRAVARAQRAQKERRAQ
ncbi:MAG: hypothetical protein ABSC37_20070 [Xanthobacteraceae bacterium]